MVVCHFEHSEKSAEGKQVAVVCSKQGHYFENTRGLPFFITTLQLLVTTPNNGIRTGRTTKAKGNTIHYLLFAAG
jgi:hypothetical protein